MTETAGMILAAGFGRRLLPATLETPKPLLHFFGVPVFELLIRQMEKTGINDIMINTHHHKEKLISAVNELPAPPEVSISEEDPILGTGGAYSRIHPWRQNRDLLVINGDVIHLFPLEKILSQHKSSGAVATMGLLPTVLPGENPVWCTGKRVVGIGGPPPRKDAVAHGFACIQILSDTFLNRITEEKESSVMTFYRDALRRCEPVEACIVDCFWNDMGTPQRFWEAHTSYLSLLEKLQGKDDFDPLRINQIREASGLGPVRWFLKNKTLFSGSEISGPCAFGSQVRFENGVRAGPGAVIMGEITLGRGISVRNCLLNKSTSYTIACDIAGVWDNDSFITGLKAP